MLGCSPIRNNRHHGPGFFVVEIHVGVSVKNAEHRSPTIAAVVRSNIIG